MSCLQVFIPCNLLHSFMFQGIPGVVAFLTAKDIPGKNSFVPVGLLTMVEEEEVRLICSYEGKFLEQILISLKELRYL